MKYTINKFPNKTYYRVVEPGARSYCVVGQAAGANDPTKLFQAMKLGEFGEPEWLGRILPTLKAAKEELKARIEADGAIEEELPFC